jgi:hypothetical protein
MKESNNGKDERLSGDGAAGSANAWQRLSLP